MHKALVAASLAVVTLVSTSPAKALVFDTSLADPPGVYFGSGNSNTHFVVSTTGSTELGLDVVERFVGPVSPDAGTATYHVALGNTTVAGKAGSLFGFAFSLNSGSSGPKLSQITTTLSIIDVLHGTTVSLDALIIPDNAGFGPGGKNVAASNLTTDYAFQNSETLDFNNVPPGSFFDPSYVSSENNTFIITWSANCTAACTGGVQSLGSVTETIIAGRGAPTAVPEPISLSLLGMGLVSLCLIGRRKSTV